MNLVCFFTGHRWTKWVKKTKLTYKYRWCMRCYKKEHKPYFETVATFVPVVLDECDTNKVFTPPPPPPLEDDPSVIITGR